MTRTVNTLSVNAVLANVTSVGTLTALTVSGVLLDTNTTDTTSITTGAVRLSGGLSISEALFVNGRITTVADPVNVQDVANKRYVDSMSATVNVVDHLNNLYLPCSIFHKTYFKFWVLLT